MAFFVDSGFFVNSALPADMKSVVATSASISASFIPTARYEGMTVYAQDNHTIYRLVNGILESNWVKIGTGSLYISSSYSTTSSYTDNANSSSYAPPHALDELTDVIITSPQVDDVLGYNGINWINKVPGSTGAGNSKNYYLDDTITFGGNQTLLPYPSISSQEEDPVTLTNNIAFIERYLSPVIDGNLDAGIWIFHTYAALTAGSSVGNTTVITRINRATEITGSVSITGTGINRTASFTGVSPLKQSDTGSEANILTATLIQSPSQSFWISSVSSSAIAIVQATTASYVNETNVSSSLYYFLFKVSTTDIDSSTITQYTTTTTQPEFSMSVGDKIVAAYFGSSDSVPSKTVAIYHGGTSSYSYIEAPLITRHNDLRGLQGGSTDEYYHLTQGEYIRFQSNSSSFASASISSSYSLNASSSINSTSASYLSGAYAIVNTLSASFITASAFVPPTDNTGTLGSLLMRWANAFINTISASYVYVSNIFGGTNDNDSLTLKGSTTNTGSVYINPIGGQVILGSELHGNKLVNLTNGSYTTVLNVYVPQNESVNVDMSLHGSWPTSGSIGYDVEMILSKGDVSTEYSQPGIILYQNNHNSNNYVMAQIVDAGLSAGSASFQIQLASSGSNVTNAKLVYDIKGTLLAAM